MPSFIFRPPSIVPNLPKSSWIAGPSPPPPPEVPNVGIRLPVVESNPPIPFAGSVTFKVNPYGDPPASVASGQLSQFKIETENPPPFPGEVRFIRPLFGDTPSDGSFTSVPAAISEGYPGEPGRVIAALATPFGISALPARPMMARTESPPPFPGAAMVNRPRLDVVRDPLVPYAVVRSQGDYLPSITQPVSTRGTPAREAANRGATIVESLPPPQFGGDVKVLRGSFGLTSLPPMPIRVQGVDSRPLESGRVITYPKPPESTSEAVRHAAIVSASPMLSHPVAQPMSWRGTPARESVSRGADVVQALPPPSFAGGVTISRPSFGLTSLPSRPILVQQSEALASEPGRVLANFGAVESTNVAIRTTTIVAGAAEFAPPSQPMSASGTPPRDAAIRTATIIRDAEGVQLHPGSVTALRSSFGITSLPSRPVIVQAVETSAEHQPVTYMRPVVAAPASISWSRSLLVSAEVVPSFAGAVMWSAGRSAPAVMPPWSVNIVRGDNSHAEPSAPFFGYGWRQGTEPATLSGVPVVLYGVDRSVVTLTSLDCECP